MITPKIRDAKGKPTSRASASGATAARAPSCLLEARCVTKSFGGQLVLDDLSLELHRGEVVLLRGENGSGKTTLLNILTGNIVPDAGTIRYLADGSPRAYRFPRRWWQNLNPWDHFRPEFVAREGIGRTWQDVRLFAGQTLRDNIAIAAPRNIGENPILALAAPRRVRGGESRICAEADAILARVGLAGRESLSADNISLGQSKPVAIARAVAAGARVLFLDEPLAGLDRRGVADVLALLEALVREHRLTLVIVEHIFNQASLQCLVTTHWLLVNGKIQRSEVRQRAADPVEHLPHHRPGCPDAQQRAAWFPHLTSEGAEILDEQLGRGGVLTRIRRPGMFKVPARPVLEISGLVVKRGPLSVVGLDEHGNEAGLDLTVYEGEISLLQAPNGWGKSTLLAAIAGLIPAHKGSIRLNGRCLDGLPIWERVRLGLRALPSDGHTFANLLGSETLRLAGARDNAKDVAAFIGRPCSSLSGGERQRLALAAMSVGVVNLYDEPFSGLDSAEPFVRRFRSFGGPLESSLVLVPSATTT